MVRKSRPPAATLPEIVTVPAVPAKVAVPDVGHAMSDVPLNQLRLDVFHVPVPPLPPEPHVVCAHAVCAANNAAAMLSNSNLKHKDKALI